MNESSKKTNSTKRNTAVIVVIILICILAIGGTIAYLTSHSELTNTFTVGSINPIDPDKPDPGPGGEGGTDVDKDPAKLNGNLYEPNWNKDDAKLFPSANIPKDPYVGVGAGSEACEVYVYVNNTMQNNNRIYFEINEGWEPVDSTAAIEGNKYTGGLFKYTGGLNASKATNNVWTTKPLFSKVVVSEDAVAGDFVANEGKDTGKIIVQSFLHQKYDANNDRIEDSIILEAAKKAFKINN